MLIETDDALLAHVERWRHRPWLAVDTEFVREDTYFAKLALIQIGDGDQSLCVDVTAVADLSPLRDLLASPDITKVLHSPDQDLEIFVNRWNVTVAPLFDTQLAATFLGIAEQPSYAALVAALTGVTLDKSLTRTPWLRRPLRAEEIAYAAADVEHLAAIYPTLEARLHDAGRLHWLHEECARLGEPARYLPQPERAWERLKSLARMPPVAQRVAARMAAWREARAVKRDRPRKWILADETIYALAQSRPDSRARLAEMQLLSPEQLQRDGNALLECIRDGSVEDASPLAVDLREFPDAQARFQRLQAAVRECATRARLPASLIAPRADLESLALQGEQSGVAALRGWRRDVAGDALLAALG